MSDEMLEETARRQKGDKRTVARLTDAAYTLMQMRSLRDHIYAIVRRDEGRAAFQIQREFDAYGRPLASHAEAVLSEYGAEAGQSSDEALALWQGLSRVYYRVPDAPASAR